METGGEGRVGEGRSMELIVRMGEREEKVAVQRVSDGYVVEIGDRTYEVDAEVSGGSRRSLLLDGDQYEVAVVASGDGVYDVTTAGGAARVEVLDPLAHLARSSRNSSGGRSANTVDAYMPGRVVAVLVEEGSEVAAGDGIVVLEAMKMENEIQSEKGGVVRKILVEPGQAVEGGDALFEIE